VTYSIVAHDARTGQLGVAVQSHWFSVGPIVPWAWPGVGAVATQANAEIAYGPRLLELLAAGMEPGSALQELLAGDSAARTRQVAVVDARGRVAVHTGSSCIPQAGDATGAGFSCQANIMASPSVWGAMRERFEAETGELSERLMAALEAAEAEGGDLRGRQSAAILVVPAQGESWRAEISLRVEDHPEPLTELRRLLRIHRAYHLAGQADELAGAGHPAQAADLYRQASELDPGNHELRFWTGLGAAAAGELDMGLAQVRAAIAAHPPWRGLLDEVPPEWASAAAAVRSRLDPEG
jgi:uncharacterized Ntn-hydrolase superfamily protein